jgi:hypothetical protein
MTLVKKIGIAVNNYVAIFIIHDHHPSLYSDFTNERLITLNQGPLHYVWPHVGRKTLLKSIEFVFSIWTWFGINSPWLLCIPTWTGYCSHPQAG